MDPKMHTQEALFSCMLPLEALFFWSRFLLRSLSNALSRQRKFCFTPDLQPKLRRHSSFACKSDDIHNSTVVFHMEEALLKSSSFFPYFMLVAFEAGGLLRAILLFLSYPLVCLFSKDVRIKIFVFFCFFGIKKGNFRIGRSVLPKFFLEDVGYEGFELVTRYRRKMAVSDLPTVMIEGFLKDYLGVDVVVGREMKVAFGYYVGLMDERTNSRAFLNEIIGQEKINLLTGFKSLGIHFSQQFLSHCKEIFMVSTAEKRKWSILPREKYPRRLIFHDGRLAFRPTFFSTLLLFMWLPFGLFVCIVRGIAAVLLPYKLGIPILAFTGMKGTRNYSSNPVFDQDEKSSGTLYVCNHRTLLDPVYVSTVLRKPVTALTYSISRVSEVISPIRTVRLKRDRENDLKMMKEMLSQGDLVVCPEGTTCREPYLLRFSPLFAEASDDIVPVGLDMQVSMFYGTTASGLKCFDPLFFLLNPFPVFKVKFLPRLPKSQTFNDGKSRYEVANYVQNEIAKALGFECTILTRKDKYLILAGNEGIV